MGLSFANLGEEMGEALFAALEGESLAELVVILRIGNESVSLFGEGELGIIKGEVGHQHSDLVGSKGSNIALHLEEAEFFSIEHFFFVEGEEVLKFGVFHPADAAVVSVPEIIPLAAVVGLVGGS